MTRLESRFLVARTRVMLRKMVTRLESRFSQNDSTRVTTNDSSLNYFYKISEFLMDKPTSFACNEMSIFSVMIKIGANFLFCLSSRSALHCKDQVSPTWTEGDLRLFFHWRVSRAHYIDTLSCFNVVRLLVTLVGTRNSNRPTDMCKFKSSQKDESNPLADPSKDFTVYREFQYCWC